MDMEQTIKIVTDSGGDLPAQLRQEFDIESVPLTVHFGAEVYRDGELTVDEFWEKAAGPHHPQTSQPPVGAYEEVFERLVAQGKQVLCMAITGKHSGTFNAAHLAAQRFGEAVTVFDSLSLSLGEGVQALAAAEAARAGRSMSEILALLESLRARIRLLIVLDTLENLRRGGRAAAFIAVADRMARALNIKVIINLEEGQLRLSGAARSFKSALARVLTMVEQMGPLDHLAVVHTRNLSTAEQVLEQLAQRIGFPRERIWLRETEGVLAVHAGPGVIGIMAVPSGPPVPHVSGGPPP
jgi:DegV family protein with EDD domain